MEPTEEVEAMPPNIAERVPQMAAADLLIFVALFST
jgi:hypothetical protein